LITLKIVSATFGFWGAIAPIDLPLATRLLTTNKSSKINTKQWEEQLLPMCVYRRALVKFSFGHNSLQSSE